MALPAAAEAVDRYLLSAGPTAANLQQRSAAGEWDGRTDRQTDTVSFHRLCSACYAGIAFECQYFYEDDIADSVVHVSAGWR